MQTADFVVVAVYGILMVAVAAVAKRKSRDVDDYFAAGHRLPWWMAAISHHVSGYSAVVFVGFAGMAATTGASIWTLFSLACFLALMIGLPTWAPRWPRLKVLTAVEYLEQRFGRSVRVTVALCGIALKLLDLGIKIFAISVVVRVCTGWNTVYICIGAGLVTILYVMIGGLWATVLTDLIQFAVQFGLSGLVVIMVLQHVGGWQSMWDRLPAERADLLNPHGKITVAYWLVALFVTVLSYNGGTWGLAQRFISVENSAQTRKVALLSGFLYLLYPLIIFIPCWAAPLILTDCFNQETFAPVAGFKDAHTYVLVAQRFLAATPGLLGLLVCSMFAATMSMIDSDVNSLAAVFTKDVYQPNLNPRANDRTLYRVGMLATIAIGLAILGVGIFFALTEKEGRNTVFQATVELFGGLVPPVFIPLMFGMLWKRTTATGALLSMVAGFAAYGILRYHYPDNYPLYTGVEILCSLTVFFGEGFLNRHRPDRQRKVEALFVRLRGP